MKEMRLVVYTPWMLVAGCAIAGWLVPEFIAALGKVRVPVGMNVLGAIAGGFIAAAFLP